jgi:hypothetical protein
MQNQKMVEFLLKMGIDPRTGLVSPLSQSVNGEGNNTSEITVETISDVETPSVLKLAESLGTKGRVIQNMLRGMY